MPPADTPWADPLWEAFRSHPAISIDSRSISPGDMFFALRGEQTDGNVYAVQAIQKGAALAVLDRSEYCPEGDTRYLLVPDSLQALQQLAARYRHTFDIPMIGLTGSNGKTTTKELAYAVLATAFRSHATKGNYNNHIGLPLTLLAMPQDTEIALLEMGSNQPGDIAFLASMAQCTHALITNIGKTHLEKLRSIEGVMQEKGALFEALQQQDGLAFVNMSDPRVARIAQTLKKRITYGSSQADYHAEILHQSYEGMEIAVYGIGWEGPLAIKSPLSGEHNLSNVLAACAIGATFGLTPEQLQAGIAAYQPTNNRSQFILKGKRQIWLDAYNANPSSMRAAIAHFLQSGEGKAALILGDMYELGEGAEQEHKELGHFIRTLAPDMVIGIGPLMQHTLAELDSPHAAYPNTKTAMKQLPKHLKGIRRIMLKGSRGVALEQLMEAL